ncbi:hypothetical protein [uncultured Dokdonia sp.]|uniref:hypothetical protein n=1 Tax=uncultured Dokdonia sp. TaxID=575653 RepID=UPI002601D740|nr:hypothetical protein [uncultured Dokdonia sp.]
MNDEIEKEIQDVLSNTDGDHILEVPISEAQSPLNTAVKTGDIADVSKKGASEKASFLKTAEDAYAKEQTQKVIADAPQQHIGDHSEHISQENETTKAVISDKQAMQTAEALLGMADNFLAVGGGFFVKITKHEEFFEFEELVEVIDSQNEKNIRRIRLDQDDKALLTPLLAQVIKNKTKQLSPEQQLLGAIISVIVKKAQTVMEVRAENKSLEGRILQIVREAKLPDTKQEEQEEKPKQKDVQVPVDEEPFEKEILEQEILEQEQEIQTPIGVVEQQDEDLVFINSNNSPLSNEMHLVYEEVAPSVISEKQVHSASSSSTNKRERPDSSKTGEQSHSQDSDDTS